MLDFYAERGRDPMVAVEADGDVEAAVPRARLGRAARTARSSSASARWSPCAAPGAVAAGAWAWWRSRATATSGCTSWCPAPPSRVAEGRAAVHDDWLGLNGLRTHLEHRRQGLAGEVLDTLLEWGAERGAMTVWLHVETDNPAARALYDDLGLVIHHVARYLVPAASAEPHSSSRTSTPSSRLCPGPADPARPSSLP